ncbi:MAG: hypothetical protein IPK60_14820 [Sandaracinaceae bacterium]|nr:hypothetical protein [Sandaracinaceae bacterium]
MPSESRAAPPSKIVPERIAFAISLGLFVVALAAPALHLQSVNGYSDFDYTGLDCLAFGWAALGRHPAWLGNLFFAVALIFEWRKKPLVAGIFALASLGFAFSTFQLADQGRAFFDPSSHNQTVASFGVAVYLWIASQLTIVVAAAIELVLRARARRTHGRHSQPATLGRSS